MKWVLSDSICGKLVELTCDLIESRGITHGQFHILHRPNHKICPMLGTLHTSFSNAGLHPSAMVKKLQTRSSHVTWLVIFYPWLIGIFMYFVCNLKCIGTLCSLLVYIFYLVFLFNSREHQFETLGWWKILHPWYTSLFSHSKDWEGTCIVASIPVSVEMSLGHYLNHFLDPSFKQAF